MLALLTAVLLCSCAAMAGLLYAKHWELSTGRVLFSSSRPHLGAFFGETLRFIQVRIPELLRQFWQEILSFLRQGARTLVARGLIAAELGLERVLHILRHKTLPPPAAAETPASAFLREVAEHKRRLMYRARAQRLITED